MILKHLRRDSLEKYEKALIARFAVRAVFPEHSSRTRLRTISISFNQDCKEEAIKTFP
jgi:hypothetical protein